MHTDDVSKPDADKLSDKLSKEFAGEAISFDFKTHADAVMETSTIPMSASDQSASEIGASTTLSARSVQFQDDGEGIQC